MKPTVKDAKVIFVDGDGKTRSGVIHEVFTQGAARITLEQGGSVQASYSDSGDPGTFHYADEAEVVKTAREARIAADKPAPAPKSQQPVAAASAPASPAAQK
jgi:hypothetical protein